MKRFRFPLQAVHNLRQMRRDEAERELAQAAAEVSHGAARLDEVACTRTAATEAYLRALQKSDIDQHEMALRINYLASLTQRESEARARLAELESAREAQRQLVTRAARDAEATAKLRERHRVRHETEAARAEQNNLDEIATVAIARRMANNR